MRCPVHDLYPNQHIDGSRPRTTLPRPLALSGSSLLLLMVPINGGPPLRRSAATTNERPNMHLWGSGSKSCNGESLTRSLAFRHFWANIPRTRITRKGRASGERPCSQSTDQRGRSQIFGDLLLLNLSGLGKSPNLRQASNTGVKLYQRCCGVFNAGFMTRRQEGGCELIDRTEEGEGGVLFLR